MAEKTPSSIRENAREFQIELLRQMITLSTSAFGLVAALAWNSVIQEFVSTYVKKWLPGGGSIISLLVYAIVVTLIAVLVTYNLSRALKKLTVADEEAAERKEKKK